MLLSLTNICKIKSASIKIDGITVLTGFNNTGKSTIGKALFLIFRSLYDISDIIKDERISSIESEIHQSSLMPINLAANGKKIFKQKDVFLSDKEKLIDFFKENVLEEGRKTRTLLTDYEKSGFNRSDFSHLAQVIQEILQISENKYEETYINRKINDIFYGAINNVQQNDEIADISLEIKASKIELSIQNNKVVNSQNIINLSSQAVYIDDPFVINLPTNLRYFPAYSENVQYLLRMIYKQEPVSMTDEIIIEKKLHEVLAKMNSVCSGKLIRHERGSTYIENDSDHEIPIMNISAGLKAFLIIKTLLLNGSIKENGTIILDEPEIHLHPQWQLVYAEIIVLLQKAFNLHILIATHSPYFLRAIELFSKKHCIEKKCNYYLADVQDNFFTFTEKTDELEYIYKKFARPMKELADMEELYANDE